MNPCSQPALKGAVEGIARALGQPFLEGLWLAVGIRAGTLLFTGVTVLLSLSESPFLFKLRFFSYMAVINVFTFLRLYLQSSIIITVIIFRYSISLCFQDYL